MSSPKTATRLLVKHALNLLSYKELALADLEAPIVAIAPFRSSLDQDERDAMLQIAEVDAVKHASVLFGETFSSMKEVLYFCRDIETPDQFAKRIKAPNRHLFDTEWDGTLEEQIARFAAEETSKAFPGKLGELIAMSGLGRMRQATDLLFKIDTSGERRLSMRTPPGDISTGNWNTMQRCPPRMEQPSICSRVCNATVKRNSNGSAISHRLR